MAPVLRGKKCFIFDQDGTVYLGDKPIQNTVDFIVRNWGRFAFRFLSNNTSKTPDMYIGKLRSLGIPAEPVNILTPIVPLARFLKDSGIKRIFPVGNRAFTRYLLELCPWLTITVDAAEAVILAYDTELTYEKLKVSCLLLQNDGVRFLATHPDFVCPSPEGPLPDIGSFIRLYEAATGRSPDMVFGKPSAELLAPLLTDFSKSEMVMAGDRLMTDKKLAENFGIDFVLVLSGEARREDCIGLERQPDYVVEDFGEVFVE